MKGSTSDPWDQDDIDDFMEPSFFKRFFGFVMVLMFLIFAGVTYGVYLLFVHFGVIA